MAGCMVAYFDGGLVKPGENVCNYLLNCPKPSTRENLLHARGRVGRGGGGGFVLAGKPEVLARFNLIIIACLLDFRFLFLESH